MTPTNPNQPAAIAAFRALHASGCFVIPNPWDIGTARYLEHLGFKALATTSAGFAFSQGLPDDVSVVSRDTVLAHVRDIASATPLPVNADFQDGYAADPESVAANVALCVETGVAGLSIEDATGNPAAPLYEFSLALERIKAARKAIDDSGVRVLLTARCEAFLVGTADPLSVALQRLEAFAQAGADCLYAPGAEDLAQVAAIVKTVAPRPVNVLVSSSIPGFTVKGLGDLGVRRISVGSAMARAAWGGFLRAAKEIGAHGTFERFAEAAPFSELNNTFKK